VPFKSPEQREYLRRHHPEVYRRWVRKYGHKPVQESELIAEAMGIAADQLQEWTPTDSKNGASTIRYRDGAYTRVGLSGKGVKYRGPNQKRAAAFKRRGYFTPGAKPQSYTQAKRRRSVVAPSGITKPRPAGVPGPTRFNVTKPKAVRAFQVRHGLKATGVGDAATRSAFKRVAAPARGTKSYVNRAGNVVKWRPRSQRISNPSGGQILRGRRWKSV
jgi:murein L,D-transpeptidase YcbB/YkuD